jgi:hypothetical protein
MPGPGKRKPDQEGQFRKRKRTDYTEIASRLATSSHEDPLLQIRRNESLDSYARLQSLICGAFIIFPS